MRNCPNCGAEYVDSYQSGRDCFECGSCFGGLTLTKKQCADHISETCRADAAEKKVTQLQAIVAEAFDAWLCANNRKVGEILSKIANKCDPMNAFEKKVKQLRAAIQILGKEINSVQLAALRRQHPVIDQVIASDPECVT